MSGRREEAALVLADGTVFEGFAAGHRPEGGIAAGEVVFNTALSGYQEIMTDPSYAGQIIAFTYPHIGNYGVNRVDAESSRPRCRGVVVRDLAARSSSWRAEGDLEAMLVRERVPAITGIDTRRLTRHIRDAGALPGAFGTAAESELLAAARADGGTEGCDLARDVTTARPYRYGDPTAPHRVVAYDFGIKTSILRRLAEAGCSVEVVPASTPAADVLARRPHGVFLSNGPGDPEPVEEPREAIREMVGRVPIFGICLGHQILALALGARRKRLRFGHHGANHPVRHLATGRVEITSQNHNYAVVADSLPPGTRLTHVNLNDGDVEGVAMAEHRAFGVQYHPEAGPGPHDARYLFDDFVALMEAG